MPDAEKDALVEKVARVLLDTADVHDLGWNNLRTTAGALLPLFAEVWDEGNDAGYSDAYSDIEPSRQASNPYRPISPGGPDPDAEKDLRLVSGDAQAALYSVDTVHQFHGDVCLCGFESPRSRSRTEHITTEVMVALARVTSPDRGHAIES